MTVRNPPSEGPEGFKRGQTIERYQLRGGMLVRTPSHYFDQDGARQPFTKIWPKAPAELVVDVWDDNGLSYLIDPRTYETDDEVGVDLNVLDYPKEFVYIGEVDQADAIALAAAIAKINRRRAQIGERPLDPARAGWSDQDVLIEAARLGPDDNPAKCARGQNRIARKAYTRKDGTRVPKTTFCADDQGRPGVRSFGAKQGLRKGTKPLIQQKGKLGGAGYTKKSERARHQLLEQCVKRDGYRSCLGRLQVLMMSTAIKGKTRKTLDADKRWLMKKHGGSGSFGARGNPTTTYSIWWSDIELAWALGKDEVDSLGNLMLVYEGVLQDVGRDASECDVVQGFVGAGLLDPSESKVYFTDDPERDGSTNPSNHTRVERMRNPY